MTYVIKDEGKDKEQFDSGAVRDNATGKPRYDLIPPGPLERLAMHYTNGAIKYSAHNWTKGMPSNRFLESLMRHLEQYRAGDREEDHLAAVAWNAFGMMYFEDTVWDNLYDWGYDCE